jgi:cobalt/nickel transport system ATP-binding protein
MVDHALKRIREYVEKSGIEFTVGVVNREEGCKWLEETDESPEMLEV